jgi:hypothetical protein
MGANIYDEVTRKLRADLGLEDTPIVMIWVRKPYVERTKSFVTYGIASDERGTKVIRVATERTPEEVCNTIAHELRHIWQYKNKVYYQMREGNQVWCYWMGSEFYRVKTRFSPRLAYHLRPHELDCRAYEKHAWENVLGKLAPEKPKRVDLKAAFLNAANKRG